MVSTASGAIADPLFRYQKITLRLYTFPRSPYDLFIDVTLFSVSLGAVVLEKSETPLRARTGAIHD